MPESVSKSIPITTSILLFLFTCGGLYLVAFWTTFGVDIIGLVQIMEIPKSFLLPFSISLGSMVFFMAIFMLTTDNKNPPQFLMKTFSYIDHKAKNKLLLSENFWIILYAPTVMVLHVYFKHSTIFWVISALVIFLLLVIKLMNLPFVSRFVGGNIRLAGIFYLAIITTITSFTLGKVKAISIYNNEEIKYVKTITNTTNNIVFAKNDSLSFKLLGFLGDKFIISSLDNKKVIILNQSAFDGVQLSDSISAK